MSTAGKITPDMSGKVQLKVKIHGLIYLDENCYFCPDEACYFESKESIQLEVDGNHLVDEDVGSVFDIDVELSDTDHEWFMAKGISHNSTTWIAKIYPWMIERFITPETDPEYFI